MNMAGGLIARPRGEKGALLVFNFRLLLVHDMTIFFFQLAASHGPLIIAVRLNRFVPQIITSTRFAPWRSLQKRL
jgi:hypothetical protein